MSLVHIVSDHQCSTFYFKIIKISSHHGMILQKLDTMSEKIAKMGFCPPNFF